MRINSIKENEVIMTLNSNELVCICNALYYDFTNRDTNQINHDMYSDLIIARDISQYGRLDNFSVARVVEERGIDNIKCEFTKDDIKD